MRYDEDKNFCREAREDNQYNQIFIDAFKKNKMMKKMYFSWKHCIEYTPETNPFCI